MRWSGGPSITATPKRIADLLAGQPGDDRNSREALVDRLAACLRDDGPVVTWFCAPAEADKASVLAALEERAASQDVRWLSVDCRELEPTAEGLLHGLAGILGENVPTPADAADALSAISERAVLVFDHYEVFRLLDAWVRREFIPSLQVSTHILFASCDLPGAGWLSAGEWRDHFDTVTLEDASDRDPLEVAREQVDMLEDAEIVDALETVSVVRRITRPMLAALCPEREAADLYERIEDLPFSDGGRDGLALHEPVHRELSRRLQAADSERYRACQRKAWSVLSRQLEVSSRADLWKNTADVIFLIENPVIR